MARKGSDPELNLEDLSGSISSPIRWDNSSFGLKEDVWNSAQGIADLLPFPVNVSGDLTQEDVENAIEKAKASDIQVMLWGQYHTEMSKWLRNYLKVRQKQADLGEAIADTRVQAAEIDKSLGESIASAELKFRQVSGNYRANMATRQLDLSTALEGITDKYQKFKDSRTQQSKNKKEEEPTEFSKQKEDLGKNLRTKRDAKVVNFSAGITSKVRAV